MFDALLKRSREPLIILEKALLELLTFVWLVPFGELGPPKIVLQKDRGKKKKKLQSFPQLQAMGSRAAQVGSLWAAFTSGSGDSGSGGSGAIPTGKLLEANTAILLAFSGE